MKTLCVCVPSDCVYPDVSRTPHLHRCKKSSLALHLQILHYWRRNLKYGACRQLFEGPSHGRLPFHWCYCGHRPRWSCVWILTAGFFCKRARWNYRNRQGLEQWKKAVQAKIKKYFWSWRHKLWELDGDCRDIFSRYFCDKYLTSMTFLPLWS